MKGDNIARAFSKVKEDMVFLKTEIELLKNKKEKKTTSKNQGDGFSELEKDLKKLQKSYETEIKKLQNQIKELNEEFNEKLSSEINLLRQEFREEILDLEQKTTYQGEELY